MALLQLQLFLWMQFIMDPLFPRSREEQKSKIYHLAVVRRTQQAACWAHAGWQSKTRDQGQIYTPLSSCIHPDEMIPFATKKEGCWPSGQFPVSWPTEEKLLLAERGGYYPHSQSSEEGGPLPVWSSHSGPALC